MIYLRDTLEITSNIVIDTPSGGLTQGTVQSIGDSDIIGFAFKTSTITATDYENYDDTATMITKARQADGTKATGASGSTFQRGDKVYYDFAGAVVTDTSTGNAPIGWALEIAQASDASVLFEFDGSLNL
jgi:hypothetical protein